MGVYNKYANEILDDIECYKLVLNNKLSKFPKGFWAKPWSLQSAGIITRYLLEERLHYTREDICKKLSGDTFKQNKLTSVLKLFNNNLYKTINNAYPDEFLPWELHKTSRGFWKSTENMVTAIKWVIEVKLENKEERVYAELNTELLNRLGLQNILRCYGIYEIVNIAYPNRFNPIKFKTVSNNYWENIENIKKAIRDLIADKLDNNRDRVCNEFDRNIIHSYGLSSLLSKYGIYELLNIAYPNEFKPWELKQVERNYWKSSDNIYKALKWILDTKFNGNKEKMTNEMTTQLLYDNGLKTLADKYGLKKLRQEVYSIKE